MFRRRSSLQTANNVGAAALGIFLNVGRLLGRLRKGLEGHEETKTHLQQIVCDLFVVIFPKQVSDCRRSGTLKGWLGTVTPERARGHEQNDSRIRFIDIYDLYLPYYCSAEVARTRALQSQQHVRARCA